MYIREHWEDRRGLARTGGQRIDPSVRAVGFRRSVVSFSEAGNPARLD